MYVDESGDVGLTGSPCRYFTLTGIVVHELRWNEYMERLVAFRKRMRDGFGLLLREEIHSAHLINKPGALARIKRNDRLSIIRYFANELRLCDECGGLIQFRTSKHIVLAIGISGLATLWKTHILRIQEIRISCKRQI